MIERSLLRLDGMKKLIFDLLDLTRIESGQKQRLFADVDLPRAGRELRSTCFQGEAAERGIAIAVDCPAGLALAADAGEIEIVLNNLVSNAVKYNRDGGRVDVTLRRDGETGHPRRSPTPASASTETEAAKLFNEFTRIKNEHTVNILGSGLGLLDRQEARQPLRRRRDGGLGLRRGQHVHGDAARRRGAAAEAAADTIT